MTMLPKIVHQIWIGPNKRPDVWMDSVRLFCVEYGYEYRLWQEREIDALSPELRNKDRYDSALQFCGKADIVRYDILHRFGGIYIDADSVVINSAGLDALISSFDGDLGCSVEPNTNMLANGVMLAPQGSDFLAECLDSIPSRNMDEPAWKATGPQFVTDIYGAGKDQFRVVTYPPHVFYPLRWHGIQTTDLHKKMAFLPESVLFQYGYSTNNLQSKV